MRFLLYPVYNVSLNYLILVDYSAYDPKEVKEYLQSLSHWNRNGKNHLVLDTRSLYFNGISSGEKGSGLYAQVDAAIIASPLFETNLLSNTFRYGYDLFIPTFRFHDEGQNLWPHLPYMLPVRRKYLFSFEGVKSKVNNLEIR